MQADKVETTSITSTFCHFDAHSECELGLEKPDSKLCAKCVADAFGDIVRTTWVGKAGQQVVNELRP
jgi:hypothetical protein